MYHYMSNVDYAGLVESLCEGGGLPESEAARCLGEAGILPKITEPFINGTFSEPTQIGFIESGDKPTPDPRFLSAFEEILPLITDELAELVEALCRDVERSDSARRGFLHAAERVDRAV